MIKPVLVSFAALVGLLAGTASVTAAPVKFDASPNNNARRIVNVLFADYIQARTGIQVYAGLTDLDDDKVGEIVVRFVHSASCLPGMKVCRTVVVRHDEIKGWQVVLDRYAETIEVLPGRPRVPAPIRTDKVTWTYDYPSYRPDFSSLGSEIAFGKLPDSVVTQVAPAFGQGAVKLAAAKMDVTFDYAEPVLGDGKKALLVKMNGDAVCGSANGCPMRMLVKNGANWSPVLSASVTDKVALGPASRDGYRDLVVSTKNGAVVLGWNGKDYAVADRLERSVVEKAR